MHPVFVDLHVELERVRQEADSLAQAVACFAQQRHTLFGDPVLHWMALGAIAFGIEKIYTGLERVMKLVAAEIDGNVPQGDAWHRTLLNRMAVQVPGVRPPVIGRQTLTGLDELRSFRHRERNSYLADLRESRLLEIAKDVPAVLTAFEADLAVLEGILDPPAST